MAAPEELGGGRDGTVLPRKLSLFSATNLVIANMIGAGIFTTSGLLMGELGSPSIMIALWLAGGILALCGALCYGELGAAMPRAGGEYVYLGELFHPSLGFLTGWVSFLVGFSAPLAASALGCSEYFASALPGVMQPGDPELMKKGLAVLIIAGLTGIHLKGMETGAGIQNLLTGGKVFLILALIVGGVVFGQGDLGHLAREGGGSGNPTPSPRTLGLSLMWIMFAYSGWNAAAYVGSEIRNPTRNLPGSLFIGTGVVILLYLSLNFLFVYAITPQDMEGVIAIGGLAAERMFGGAVSALFSGLIAFALLSSISALIILGPRVYYAMARDGYFFRSIGKVHPRTRAPANSILLQGFIAVLLVLSGTFDQILTYMGFCLGIFPILAVLGLFKLRRSGRSPYRMPGFPFVPILFASVSLSILVLAYLERPVESTIALLTVAAGIPFFFFFRRVRNNNPVISEPDDSQHHPPELRTTPSP
jgi:APA family basic amino acid/polyamine antiporter